LLEADLENKRVDFFIDGGAELLFGIRLRFNPRYTKPK